MTEIQNSISNLTSIEADKLRIRVDINENDEVVAIIVVVTDKAKAYIISDKINELECNKSSSDSYGSASNEFFF